MALTPEKKVKNAIIKQLKLLGLQQVATDVAACPIL
jgi:hypothetical protein